MSTTSPQQKAALQNADLQSQWASQLAGLAMPEYQMLLGQNGMSPSMLAGKDATGRLGIDAAALKSSTDQLNAGYGQAGFGNNEYINYMANRMGESRRGFGPTNAMMQGAATSLERDRQAALANLNFMSAQSSMADYNKLLGLMGQGTQGALGLAQGYMGLSNQAIGGMNPNSEMSGILGGASSGAGLGFSVGGPWGAAAGGILGGIGGYLGSR